MQKIQFYGVIFKEKGSHLTPFFIYCDIYNKNQFTI